MRVHPVSVTGKWLSTPDSHDRGLVSQAGWVLASLISVPRQRDGSRIPIRRDRGGWRGAPRQKARFGFAVAESSRAFFVWRFSLETFGWRHRRPVRTRRSTTAGCDDGPGLGVVPIRKPNPLAQLKDVVLRLLAIGLDLHDFLPSLPTEARKNSWRTQPRASRFCSPNGSDRGARCGKRPGALSYCF
jgi:hypothetical protein